MSNAYTELIFWRAIAAVTWSSAAVLLLSPLIGLSSSLLIQILNVLLVLSHIRCLSAREPRPAETRLPCIGSQMNADISRVVGRLLMDRKAKDAVSAGIMVSSLASIVVTLDIIFLSSPLVLSLLHGLSLSSLYALQHLGRGRNLLFYPEEGQTRSRMTKIKEKLHPTALVSAAKLSGLTALLTTFLPTFILHTSTFSSALILSFKFLIPSFAACLLALSAQAIVEVIWTMERKKSVRDLMNRSTTCSQVLLAGLSSKSPLIQDIALSELTTVAEDMSSTNSLATRNALVFSDETGRNGWTPVISFLIAEVKEVTDKISVLFLKASSSAQPLAPNAYTKPWNGGAIAAKSSTASSKAKDQKEASWCISSRYHRTSWCLRSLSALAAASRHEDRFGVVLLCEPSLAEVVATLASSALALGEYSRSQPSEKTRAGRGSLRETIEKGIELVCLPVTPTLGVDVEELALSLEKVAIEGLRRVCKSFGEGLLTMEALAKAKPSSSDDVMALLKRIIKENL